MGGSSGHTPKDRELKACRKLCKCFYWIHIKEQPNERSSDAFRCRTLGFDGRSRTVSALGGRAGERRALGDVRSDRRGDGAGRGEEGRGGRRGTV